MNYEPDPTRSEGASRAWATRRASKFNAALRLLLRPRLDEIKLEELQHAAHEISEQLAAHLPEDSIELPRAYRTVKNGHGERGIAKGDQLFSPAFTSPAPDRRAIELWAADLKDGWLRDVLVETGAVLHFREVQERRK